ncbi:MAG: twin-arginine translocase TatA/TatE family subunit [Solirubrobacterales bacterium]|nr:twin-arginine translocase TatA/TatE family subunit [Solirubrobacterales bacterium]
MPTIGPLEIAIVVIIALVIFGPKRLPGLGRQAGKGIREFRGAVTGDGLLGVGSDDASKDPPARAADAPAEASSSRTVG